jgi:hypothetical protein
MKISKITQQKNSHLKMKRFKKKNTSNEFTFENQENQSLDSHDDKSENFGNNSIGQIEENLIPDESSQRKSQS